jgi:hypothetical protein
MTRLKLMSLASAVAIYIAPIVWLMGPTDEERRTESFAAATTPGSPPRMASCEPGDRINSSAADAAREKTESKDFADVRRPRSGCDNVWYALAPKEGRDGAK